MIPQFTFEFPDDEERIVGPWSVARQRIFDKDAEAELDAYIKAGMITPAQAAEVMKKQQSGESTTPMDALSKDPKFLDKVFMKNKPKKKK